jgi:hypothetical protein
MSEPVPSTKQDLKALETELRTDMATQFNNLSNLVHSSAMLVLAHLIQLQTGQDIEDCKTKAIKELCDASAQTH